MLVAVMCNSVLGDGFQSSWDAYCGSQQDQLPPGTYYVCFQSEDGPPQDAALTNAKIFTGPVTSDGGKSRVHIKHEDHVKSAVLTDCSCLGEEVNFAVAFASASGLAQMWTDNHPVQVRISDLQSETCVDYDIGASEPHTSTTLFPDFVNFMRFCQNDPPVDIST
ncbi:uncharacterized protein SRS1_25005 [Sporisorium reilianum f. sp. reilianum]|uniref:Uncharacterized protein n=1 Tax=Sporisorium reilianum f. sp. reilianum TaxID=72559 RepID=A0A2N8UI60_9BASI|nr:uncharacterized protein SRS1_25005 [Sporisorium reilianum f. sp. reilianum]